MTSLFGQGSIDATEPTPTPTPPTNESDGSKSRDGESAAAAVIEVESDTIAGNDANGGSGGGGKGGIMNLPVNLNVSSPFLREWFAKRREEVRPWSTFLKTTNFEAPKTVPKLSKRVIRNIEHFQSNYVFVFLILFIYCLVTSPLLLIVLAASGSGCYYLSVKQRERKLMLGGHEVSLAQQYGLVGLCSIPLFLIAGAGSVVFWVIGASFFFIGLHAAFYNFDALDLDDPDAQPLTGDIVEEV